MEISIVEKTMPTIFRIGQYRFYFNSREETRMHIHIDSTDGTTKFWLEPIVALEVYYNMKSKELSEIEEIVKERKDEFIHEWKKYFSV